MAYVVEVNDFSVIPNPNPNPNRKTNNTPQSSRNSTQLRNAQMLEQQLESELFRFFNIVILKDENIIVGDIESIKKKYDRQVKNIIRKYTQKGLELSHDYIKKFVKEAGIERKYNNGFEIPVYQSEGDTQNIELITISILNLFWGRANKIIQRNIVNSEIKIDQTNAQPDSSVVEKKDFDTAANMALTANAIFSIFNTSLPEKIKDLFTNVADNQINATSLSDLKEDFEIIFLSRNDGLVDANSKIKPCVNNHGNTWEIDDIGSMVIPPEDLHPHCRCILAIRHKKTGKIFL